MKYENNSYITVLSTENYLQGVLALAESLKKTNSKYPLNVLITENISQKTEEILNDFNLNVIRKNKIDIPNSIKEKNEKGVFSNWTNTFDKLQIFELTEFHKLVYLDSDMYIRKNIDELFEKENMSATADRRIGPIINDDWIKITSGLMVVQPQKGIIDSFKKIILEIEEKRESIGDQDILQEYDKEWEKKTHLHLDDKYNMFFPHIDFYIQYKDYKIEDIYVVHFIYNKKPFFIDVSQMREYMQFINDRKKENYKKYKLEILKNYINCGDMQEEKVLKEYFEILEVIRKRIKNRY